MTPAEKAADQAEDAALVADALADRAEREAAEGHSAEAHRFAGLAQEAAARASEQAEWAADSHERGALEWGGPVDDTRDEEARQVGSENAVTDALGAEERAAESAQRASAAAEALSNDPDSDDAASAAKDAPMSGSGRHWMAGRDAAVAAGKAHRDAAWRIECGLQEAHYANPHEEV